MVLTTNLEYESGANMTSSYVIDANGNVNQSSDIITYTTTKVSDTTTHQVGFWLAIASFFGFLLTLLSTRRTNYEE